VFSGSFDFYMSGVRTDPIGFVLGGILATVDKKHKRAILVEMLRELAHYVQAKSKRDEERLRSSGFRPVSTNNAQQQLPTPSVPRLRQGISGQMLLKTKPIPNAKLYETEVAVIDADGASGPWKTGGFSTDSRSMAVSGLTPGTIYAFRIRAHGGSTGFSDWSDPVRRMCI
jgi:hypothetical protein